MPCASASGTKVSGWTRARAADGSSEPAPRRRSDRAPEAARSAGSAAASCPPRSPACSSFDAIRDALGAASSSSVVPERLQADRLGEHAAHVQAQARCPNRRPPAAACLRRRSSARSAPDAVRTASVPQQLDAVDLGHLQVHETASDATRASCCRKYSGIARRTRRRNRHRGRSAAGRQAALFHRRSPTGVGLPR